MPPAVHLDIDGYRGSEIEAAQLPFRTRCCNAFATVARRRAACPSPPTWPIAVAEIASSRRPMLVVGVGAAVAGIAGALAEFAETFEVPVATSVGGRGLLATTPIRSISAWSAPIRRRTPTRCWRRLTSSHLRRLVTWATR